MSYKHVLVATLLGFFFSNFSHAQQDFRLWYKKPANKWEETLPLGNGRLGIMPDGGIVKESIILNDITLWSGGPQDADRPGAANVLPQIQKLLFEGKNDEAEALVNQNFVCQGAGTGWGKGKEKPYGCYQMLGRLNIAFDYGADTLARPEDYTRELSLNKALASCSFKLNTTTYSREYFVSLSEDAIIIRIKAEGAKKINATLSLNRPERFETKVEDNIMRMSGQLSGTSENNGMLYSTWVKVIPTNGTVTTDGNQLKINEASSAVIVISSYTNFRNTIFTEDVAGNLGHVASMKYDELKENHIQKYQEKFNRCLLIMPSTKNSNLSTDERLKAFSANPDDADFAALYFQYGRYLLISSTGVLPPNLQGLWANTTQTPWNGDYHLNINVQINHWPAEVTGLPELHMPFIEMIKKLSEPGEKTAKTYYNAKGWTANTITNIWGYTAPGEGASWGSYSTGGGWLCEHLWEHYSFNPNKEYLESVYPVMKGSAEFFLSTLVKDPKTGWLVTAPTNSPENNFLMPNGKKASICMGSTMDNQIVRELFTNVIKASEILKTDADLRQKMQAALKQIPPTRVGKHGQIMEWLEDYDEVDTLHRHISQLYGLHPSNQISPYSTPELAQAARVTLARRGDGSTGWSRAWKVNFWARLGDGNHAYKLLSNLLQPASGSGHFAGGSYPNLFCAHPPFQIDGNFGGCAGIAEMLIQSHAGFIEFLPALPDAWSSGSFRGMRVRGGGTVSANWSVQHLTSATLTATIDGSFKIRIPAYADKFTGDVDGKKLKLKNDNGLVTVALKKGETLTLNF
jgi:alpha-L-fucosidase 2